MAFFCFWVTVFQPAGMLFAADPVKLCAERTFDMTGSIKSVIDGDTVIMENDLHVRLIGIDTPEINYRTGESEAGALAAKDYLSDRLRGKARVGLIFDEERQDRYGRTLAHLYLDDGSNIQAELLGRGLAVAYTYPPNLRNSECYYQLADEAMAGKRGLWGLDQYRPLAAEAVSGAGPGYRVIYGKIRKISDSRRSLILHFTDNFIVTILKSDLKFFNTKDINAYRGNQIRVQGELYSRNGHYWMAIRHPLNIRLTSGANNSFEMNR